MSIFETAEREVIILDSTDEENDTPTQGVARRSSTTCFQDSDPDDFDWGTALELVSDAFDPDPVCQDNTALIADAPTLFTEQDCLSKVLEIFPDIAHDRVLNLYRDGIQQGLCGADWCDELITQILDGGGYPKERERRQELKRKRVQTLEDPDDVRQWERLDREAPNFVYTRLAQKLLAEEFPEIPVKYISDTFRIHKYLFKAYFVLEAAERTYNATVAPYKRVRSRSKKSASDSPEAMSYQHNDLLKELNAARQRRRREDGQRKAVAEKELLEAQNERHARATNSMGECGCCFSEYPTNRMTYCNGDTVHFFCHECASNYVKTEIGQSRCRPKCMETSGCQGGFGRSQLQSFLDPKSFEKLEQLQQQEELRLASIDDLTECPFCDFKAIYPPVEVDREFRCSNPDCERISCRLCQLDSHVPKSCEEAAKDNKGKMRHTVEEAMSEALIRSCNKCKNKFVKDFGCNKMTCPSCGNKQCYVCSANVRGYEHFEGQGKCRLNDNTDARHVDEVKKAEEAALAKLKAENPDVAEEDLKVKVSERVKGDEQALLNRAGRFPFDVAPHIGDPFAALGAEINLDQRLRFHALPDDLDFLDDIRVLNDLDPGNLPGERAHDPLLPRFARNPFRNLVAPPPLLQMPDPLAHFGFGLPGGPPADLLGHPPPYAPLLGADGAQDLHQAQHLQHQAQHQVQHLQQLRQAQAQALQALQPLRPPPPPQPQPQRPQQPQQPQQPQPPDPLAPPPIPELHIHNHFQNFHDWRRNNQPYLRRHNVQVPDAQAQQAIAEGLRLAEEARQRRERQRREFARMQRRARDR